MIFLFLFTFENEKIEKGEDLLIIKNLNNHENFLISIHLQTCVARVNIPSVSPILDKLNLAWWSGFRLKPISINSPESPKKVGHCRSG